MKHRVTRSRRICRKQIRQNTEKLKKKKYFYFNPWLIVSLLLVLGGTLYLLKPKLKYAFTHTSAKLMNFYEASKNLSMGEKIAFWSEKLILDPKLLVPFGAGPKLPDSLPLFSKKYDCTTYVETVAALAKSKSTMELADQIIRIRYYRGNVSYETRNHFPEADWIPNNKANRVLSDVTENLAYQVGLTPSFAKKEIHKKDWLEQNKGAYRFLAQSSPDVVSVRVPYIPLQEMPHVLKHVSQGSLVNIVRENKSSKPVLITHQGFLIWKGGKAYFRHADKENQVLETPWEEYVDFLKSRPWKVLGFNINTFNG